MVDAVAREWLVWPPLEGGRDHGERYLDKLMKGFLAIFYVDDAYFASRDLVFLQTALSILVELFECVGLEINCLQTQAMICTPGRIHTQLPNATYHCMHLGYQTSKQWEACHVNRSHCNAKLQARFLLRHLATLHGVYQQTVVMEELLDKHECVMYKATQHPSGQLMCPIARCLGVAKDGWNIWRHFRDLHPRDKVIVPKEGRSYLRCQYCRMQVNPLVTGHWKTESCALGTDRRIQRKVAVTSTLALSCTFQVHVDVSERVEVFKYLRCLLAQDDNDIQAVRHQIRKARAIWARVGQVL